MSHIARNKTNWRTRSGLLVATGLAVAIGSIPAGAAVGPDLGAARSFAALGGSTLTNTGATTAIVGDVGVSPGSAITGLTPSQVSGGIYVGGDAEADQAHSDAALAYTFLAGMASNTNLTSTDLGGLTLAPGVYTFNSSAALTGAMFLDAGGDSGAVFVFQIGTSFTTAPGSSVTVINGGADYDESNIYWQVGSSATLGTTTAFLGVIIADQSVTLETGATLSGIALAINGAASLDSNQVTSPPLVVPATLSPIDLTAVLSGPVDSPSGDLSWTDASNNESEFRVYRRDGAGPAFVLIATVPSADTAGIGSVTTYQDSGLAFDETYAYRVTAYGVAAGESAPSNEALLDTGGFVPQVIAPINLSAVINGTLANPGANLSWTDASDNESEFRVYRRDGAGPAFVLIGTVASADTVGVDDTVNFPNPALSPSTTYTYRVTAFSPADGESAPSNHEMIDTAEGPTVRWLDVDLGRMKSTIRDRKKINSDSLFIRGSYSVIDIETGVPTVVDDLDPRQTGITIRVQAPANVFLLTIPANDPNWKASKYGIYRWRSPKGGSKQIVNLMIDTNKSEFTIKTKRSQFLSVPQSAITVSLTCGGATGADGRTWTRPKHIGAGNNANFKVERSK
jgi:hypothetical protein